jgi:tetratricopeptide (TPR) repeat protein
MELSIESLVNNAKEHYSEGEYELANAAAVKATQVDSDEVEGWWFATLSSLALNNVNDAHEYIAEVVELAPYFANGWAKYGSILQKLYDDELDEDAISAFEKAVDIEPEHLYALNTLANIRRQIDSSDPHDRYLEVTVLSKIDAIEGLTPNQINRLGVLHYSTKNFLEAIKAWERNVSAPSGVSLYNLGLAFNHTEVSQDADAIDIWRIALEREVLPDKVKDRISALLPRLLTLAIDSHKSCSTVIERENFFDVYLNPFELLNYSQDVDVDVDLDGEFDFKKAQRNRKRLIQELELEDGVIHWLDDKRIDKSRVISVCDELYDDRKRYFHALVFNNKELLNFLSKGSHQHFCVDENSSPIELIKVLDDINTGFKTWLSAPFSVQFDRVLSAAVKKRLFFIVEVLLDGRRWVDSRFNEDCFRASKKELNKLLDALDDLELRSEVEKIPCDEVKRDLEYNGLLELLNLLPSFFWEQQNRAVKCIRQIAIATYNEHGDADSSKEIIELTNLFDFKSEELKQRISEDIQSIDNIIQEKKKDEVHLVLGSNKTVFKITESGVKHGEKFIPTNKLKSLRWGAIRTRETNGITNDAVYAFSSTDGERIFVSTSYNESNETAKRLDDSISNGILAYLFPSVLERVKESIGNGQTIRIGDISINSHGVSFESGWFIFASEKTIKWKNYKAEVSNGSILVLDKQNQNIQISISIRDVDNAFLLLFMGQERE